MDQSLIVSPPRHFFSILQLKVGEKPIIIMGLHREGRVIIPVSFIILAGVWSGLYFPLLRDSSIWPLGMILGLAALIMFGLILNFFRNPKIEAVTAPDGIISPADGKVVVIEEIEDPHYFKGKVTQISVFMSPLNVHVNRNPISGTVKYHRYHKGKYLVAYNPKSSQENEQTMFVIGNDKWEVGFKQIAGAVARRICWYIKEGDKVQQSQEMGFIKFGSRLDILVPTDAEILVELGQPVRGGITELARKK